MHKIYSSPLLLIGLLFAAGLTLASSSTASATNTCSDIKAPIYSWIKKEVEKNKPFYLKTSKKTGVPWEMLAAIHYRETNFSHTNPYNKQGIFQFVNGDGGPYPPGPVSDENFQKQLDYMASRVQSDYVYRGSLDYTKRKLLPNEPDDFRVQDTLFSYNGRATVYANQAKIFGFNSSTQPYQGSPYVMNMFDCARANMGQITRDYGSLDGIDSRYGAFTLYARLKGDAYWQSRYDNLKDNTTLKLPGCNTGNNTNVGCAWRLRGYRTGNITIAPNISDRDKLITYGHELQGVEFHTYVKKFASTIPVYQLTTPYKKIFLTPSKAEADKLVATKKYTGLKVAFYANKKQSNNGFPVYRYYNANKQHYVLASRTSTKKLLASKGYVSQGEIFRSVSPLYPELAAPEGQDLVYRFFMPHNNGHLWTTDLYERDSLIKRGYPYERVAWYGLKKSKGAIPVYRLYEPNIKQHIYTTDAYEKKVLSTKRGWNYEGIAYYVSGVKSKTPVYRLYSPALKVHHLTKDAYEVKVLTRSKNWISEGVAWYQKDK